MHDDSCEVSATGVHKHSRQLQAGPGCEAMVRAPGATAGGHRDVDAF